MKASKFITSALVSILLLSAGGSMVQANASSKVRKPSTTRFTHYLGLNYNYFKKNVYLWNANHTKREVNLKNVKGIQVYKPLKMIHYDGAWYYLINYKGHDFLAWHGYLGPVMKKINNKRSHQTKRVKRITFKQYYGYVLKAMTTSIKDSSNTYYGELRDNDDRKDAAKIKKSTKPDLKALYSAKSLKQLTSRYNVIAKRMIETGKPIEPKGNFEDYRTILSDLEISHHLINSESDPIVK